MSWLSKLWSWIKARWKWVAAIAAVLVGGIAMAASWPRKRTPKVPPAAPVGLSPKQAEAARKQAEAAHAAEVDQAAQDLQGALQRIAEAKERKKKQGGQVGLGAVTLLLGLSLLGLAACRTPRPVTAPAPLADQELAGLCSTCLEACETGPDSACLCAEGCERAKYEARVARADAKESKALAGADAAEAARVVQQSQERARQAEQERDEAKAQRWDWFGWGALVGAVAASVVVGVVFGR